jgi:hypothetical protein
VAPGTGREMLEDKGNGDSGGVDGCDVEVGFGSKRERKRHHI